jgi:TonB family protein
MLAPLGHRLVAFASREDGSRALTLALIASTALHASLIAWHSGGRGDPRPAAAPPSLLQAELMPAPASDAVVLAAAAPAPFAVPSPAEPAVEPLPPARPKVTAVPAGPLSRPGPVGTLRISATPVTDRSRIGEYVDREMRDFPPEIDYLPRAADSISVPYPAAALAAGREDTVTVWFIVNPEGKATEVSVVEGSPEFADVVTAALGDARFVPARNHMATIAFPLSLEFRFALPAATPAGVPPVTASAPGARP